MAANRLVHSCYGDDDLDCPTASVCLEMSEVGSIKHEAMEVFEDDVASTHPFDPVIDHFRVLTQYSSQKQLLIVSVLEVGGQVDVTRCQGAQVRLALLADKVVKKRTSFVNGPPPFKFNETFAFKILEAQLENTVLRFRFYKKRLPKRSQSIGESYLKGTKIGAHALHLLKLREPFAVKEQPQLLAVVENGSTIRSQVSASGLRLTKSTRSAPFGRASGKENPKLLHKISKISEIEVLICLAYSEVHETFRVGIEKTKKMNRLLEPDGKPIDCYFQLIVRAEGVELCRHRTKTLNCEGEADLNEFVVVPCALRRLENITVIIGFFCVHGLLKRRVLMGWVRLGSDEVENADAAEHWSEMVHDIGRSVDRWHTLRRPRNLTL